MFNSNNICHHILKILACLKTNTIESLKPLRKNVLNDNKMNSCN